MKLQTMKSSVNALRCDIRNRLATGELSVSTMQTAVDNLLVYTNAVLEQGRTLGRTEVWYFAMLEAYVLELARIAQQQQQH